MPRQLERGLKKSAFSCDPCRRRKVKCGGQRPQCDRCTARKDECEYKLGPTLSYTERLESKVRELQTLLQQATKNAGAGERPRSTVVGGDNGIASSSNDSAAAGSWLSTDSTGRISLHGPTSIFNTPFISSNSVDNTITSPALANDPKQAERRRKQLVTNAWVQRAAEAIASDESPFHSLLHYLLDFHWTWIQPIFNFVYRPAFTRDMKHFGPYYSHTLLSTILAHSVRWCHYEPQISEALADYEHGHLFSSHAKLLLHEDLQNGRCDIPTVQALLLISTQECGKGNSTQAWVYSGIAFRLAEDLGITIDARKYAGDVKLSEEDIEIRNRLFWSCYIWDKMISLYLGRCPVMSSSDISPPQIMTDDSTEYDAWVPHALGADIQSTYGTIQSYAVSTFVWTCKLMEIVHEVLVEVYDPAKHRTRTEFAACLLSQRQALEVWSKGLPAYLRLSGKALPEQSPPNHIVTLNCLYDTTNILIHKPMVSTDELSRKPISTTEALSICLSSASNICTIVSLFCRSFGSGRCTMALAYSMYTAALIFLLQLESRAPIDDEGLKNLAYCLGILQYISEIHAVLKRPLQLLREQLDQQQVRLGVDSADSLEAT